MIAEPPSFFGGTKVTTAPPLLRVALTAVVSPGTVPAGVTGEEVLDELDPAKARALANDVDKMLWDEVFSLALYQSPGNVAVRSNLANFGPAGIGDLDYSAIGFMK